MAALPLLTILALVHGQFPQAAPETVGAIACQESGVGRQHCSAVSPYDIRDNCAHRSFFPNTQAQGIAIATELLHACSSIDVGPMQVNSMNWAWTNLTVQTAFDQRANIAAGIRILESAYDTCGGLDGQTPDQQTERLKCALSRYHTGKDNEVGRSYARSVWRLSAYVPSIRDLSVNGANVPGAATQPPSGGTDAPSSSSVADDFCDAVVVHAPQESQSKKEIR